MKPTLLVDAPLDSRVVCEEIFAPVVSVLPVDSVEEAIERTNRSNFGLQAGIFTADLETALLAGRRLEVGGVIVNGTSSTRADLMPYGGVKDSGHGKEGPHYAIREMTEERLIVLRGRRRG
jgi:acyl-CoA reductase-like NAD-dependent aldehyde dehydrogenase